MHEDILARHVLDAAIDVIIVIDEAGIILTCNPAVEALLGYVPSELVGRPIDVLVPEPDKSRHADYIRRYLSSGVPRVMGEPRSLFAERKDGTTTPITLAVTELKVGDRRVFPGIIRDARLDAERRADLRRRGDELRVQSAVNRVLQQANTLPELYEQVLLALVDMGELQVQKKAGIFLIEPVAPAGPNELPLIDAPEKALRLVHTVGKFTDEFYEREAWVPLGACLCGRAAISGEVIVSANCFHDAHHDHSFEGMTAHGHYILPLKSKDEVFGVLYLYTDPDPVCDERRIVLLESIGTAIGLGLRRLKAEAALRASRAAFERLAHEDELTGLFSRRAVLGHLRQARSQAQRKGEPVSVVLIDADRFKRVNDTYGHPAGDAVLVELARRMQASVRPYDSCGRYGGEEFLLVLPNCGQEEAKGVAERIRIAISGSPMKAGEHNLPVTISLGVVTSTEHDLVDEALISAADTALYEAKEGGRNRAVSVVI